MIFENQEVLIINITVIDDFSLLEIKGLTKWELCVLFT